MTLLWSNDGQGVNLSNAQVGSAEATNRLVRRYSAGGTHYALVRITTTIGAAPTCTYTLEMSPDGAAWFPAAYQDISSPGAVPALTTAQMAAITTATTKWLVLPGDWPWSQFRITYSANNNVTNTVDAWVV